MHASLRMYLKSLPPFSFIFYSLLLLQIISNSPSLAADTISLGQSISGNQTIVSARGKFELGFFTPGKSRNYYIGIWYKNIPKQTVVWVANRATPVSDPTNSHLKLTETASLVLLSNSSILVWSSNSTSSSSSRDTVVVLLDIRNLVLRDRLDASVIVWQSFDHPTDTRLVGGWIGMDKVTGEYQSLTPWKNSANPAPGPFTCTIDPSGADQFILQWNYSRSYWSSGVWNGQSFSKLPAMNQSSLFVYKFVDDDKRRYLTVNLTTDKILMRTVMSSSGQVGTWMWYNDAQGWVLVWQQPLSPCDVYSACGAFGICDPGGKIACSCPHGFSPASMRDWELDTWYSGCTRNTRLQCWYQNLTSGEKDGFIAEHNLRLPEDAYSMIAATAEECEKVCLRSCSCTAYAYESGCSIWRSNIRTLHRLPDGNNGVGTLHLRLAASDVPQQASEKNLNTKVIVIAAAAGSDVLMILVLILIFYRRRNKTLRSNEGPLVSFIYSDLQRMTKNFSEMLGSGGFGSVFKGVLPDSTVVAVKRLEGVRQGEKQFQAELGTLGMIQHVNLARLHGFCCEGTNRLLVYDYMPNGSLDKHLFQEQSKSLKWNTRFQIIQGIARGLAYLHEECRECIIHCDVKPENILLDSEYCPKLADFGMAKLLGHDFSRVLTTIGGTIGYLAPEWISGLPITCKADVYSFGMMLFEVVSGGRNSEMKKDGVFSFFPVQAATKVLQGEVLSLLDKSLEGNTDILELTRVCQVACWCIQDAEIDRPSMGEIVKILEGILDMETPPFPLTLQKLAEEDPPSP